MDQEPIKLDENGIPVLEESVAVDQPADAQAPQPALDLADRELVECLLHLEAVQPILNDLAGDLQKSVAVQVETILQQEIPRLIREVTEQNARQLTQQIRDRLQLALPDLLIKLADQAKRS